MKSVSFETGTKKLLVSMVEVDLGEWSVRIDHGNGNFTMFPESDEGRARQSAQFLADRIAFVVQRPKKKRKLSDEARRVLEAKKKGGILRRNRQTDVFEMYVPGGGFAAIGEKVVRELIRARKLPRKTLTHYQEIA